MSFSMFFFSFCCVLISSVLLAFAALFFFCVLLRCSAFDLSRPLQLVVSVSNRQVLIGLCGQTFVIYYNHRSLTIYSSSDAACKFPDGLSCIHRCTDSCHGHASNCVYGAVPKVPVTGVHLSCTLDS